MGPHVSLVTYLPPSGVPLFTSPPSTPSWTLGSSFTPEDFPQASPGPSQPASAALKMPHHHPGNFHFPSFHFSCFVLAFLWSLLPLSHPRTPSQGLHHHYHPSLARDPHVHLRKTLLPQFLEFLLITSALLIRCGRLCKRWKERLKTAHFDPLTILIGALDPLL